jgi:hypothetical protein
MRMKFGTRSSIALVILGLSAQPALANNKDRAKRTDANTPCAECCKPSVRSMSESTPMRKGDCPKARRILM